MLVIVILSDHVMCIADVCPVIRHTRVFPQAVVDAVLAIRKPNEPIDLYMVEIMEMKHKTDSDTQ